MDRYGDEAEFSTPLDNPYVLKLLRLLGFDTVEEFLEQSDIFIRHFKGSTERKGRAVIFRLSPAKSVQLQ